MTILMKGLVKPGIDYMRNSAIVPSRWRPDGVSQCTGPVRTDSNRPMRINYAQL